MSYQKNKSSKSYCISYQETKSGNYYINKVLLYELLKRKLSNYIYVVKQLLYELLDK